VVPSVTSFANELKVSTCSGKYAGNLYVFCIVLPKQVRFAEFQPKCKGGF
jgi:hypothetical protein